MISKRGMIHKRGAFNWGSLALAAVFISATATAEIYKRVDSNGNVYYSDEESEGAEKIEVEPITTISLPKPQNSQSNSDPAQLREIPGDADSANSSTANYQSLTVTSPGEGDAFWSGSGEVTVRYTTEPALQKGDQFQITLDGETVRQTRSNQVTLDGVVRGQHQLAVSVVDPSGNSRIQSDTINFTLHQPSKLN